MNEIETTIKKAAIGSAFPVGLADAIATSVSWLCQRDLDGLAAGLDAVASDFQPVDARSLVGSVVRLNRRDARCLGPSLFELVATTECERVEIDDPGSPLLFVGLAAIVSRGTETAFELAVAGGDSIVVSAATVAVPARFAHGARRLMVTAAGAAPPPSSSGVAFERGVEVDDRCWTRLGDLASRTYVPANDESRARGAGAGLDDND